jgi:hypothetical protein
MGLTFGNFSNQFIEFSATFAGEIRAYHLNFGHETRYAVKKNGRLPHVSSDRQMQSINLYSPLLHCGQKPSLSLISPCSSRVLSRPSVPILGENMIEISSDESATQESNKQGQVKRWIVWHVSVGILGGIIGFFGYPVFTAIRLTRRRSKHDR